VHHRLSASAALSYTLAASCIARLINESNHGRFRQRAGKGDSHASERIRRPESLRTARRRYGNNSL